MHGIGLDQHTIKIQAGQQFLERCLLAGFVGVVALLRECRTEGSGVDGDLSNDPVMAVFRLDG